MSLAYTVVRNDKFYSKNNKIVEVSSTSPCKYCREIRREGGKAELAAGWVTALPSAAQLAFGTPAASWPDPCCL